MNDRQSIRKKGEARSHVAKAAQSDPNVLKRRAPWAKYIEAFGVSYSRGGMRPRLLP